MGGRKPWQADYGQGEHTIDCDQLGFLDEQALTDRLVQTFDSPGYHPPRLPEVATELLALSQDPDVEFRRIESLLERDAMLAGEVLSVARSAFYARSGSVVLLREALSRVGLEKLRGIVMQAAMTLRVFRSASYRGWMERLQAHCLATAHVARFVSRHTPIPEEQAFLCGLLHDVGIAGILLVLGDVGRGKQPPALDVLWPAIHAAHPKAGARMVQLWGLPPDLALAVGAHHQVRIEKFDHPLAAANCLAEALTAELDMALVPAGDGGELKAELAGSPLPLQGRIDQSDALTLERARGALALTDSTLDRIRSDAREWARASETPTPASEARMRIGHSGGHARGGGR
ncbi:MAG: HDOD domain-containing protein [Acidobacteriia bacterium]|nr:HDOD domain-containing protein [Terriglobia bacterium]